MSTQPAPITAPIPSRENPARYFYSIATIVLLVLTVIGFHHFYFEARSYPGRPITPPIRGLVIAHGLSMSAWMLLAIAQPLLIASRKHRLHMTLGKIGAVLAGLIVVLGFVTATNSTRVAPPDMMFGPLTPKQFMSVPYTAALMFGVFVAIGVWKRKRPEIHRPMMFLATLSAMSAALDRIDQLKNIFVETICYRLWGPFFTSLLLGAVLLAVKSALTRSLDKVFAVGLAALAVVTLVMTLAAPTSAWDSFASLFVP